MLDRHRELLIATNGFCEHIHFKREWLRLDEIAHKAMLVNLSDILAMNATPKYALFSITLPALHPKEITQIALALAKVAKEIWH